MNPTDPLAQLRDIHLPEAISWWPLAFGWWVIVIICLLAIALSLRYLIKTFVNRRYRRQALAKLKMLPDSNQHQRLTDLFNLLKQVACSAYPKQNFASLNNRDFVSFYRIATLRQGLMICHLTGNNFFTPSNHRSHQNWSIN